MLISGVNATHTGAAVAQAKQLLDVGAEGLVIFPPLPAFIGQVTVDMAVDYHRAIAAVAPVPIIAFQTVFTKYPKGTITALSEIPNIVAIKDASFDVEQTLENIKEARSAKRRIGVLTGSDTFILEAMLMGSDGALIGFAATATAEIIRMHALASAGKITEAYGIWDKLGPLARICWRTPLRDYRVRTKYALQLQGVLPGVKVRPPFAVITPADRADIDQAFREHGLASPRFHPAGVAADGAAPKQTDREVAVASR
jgi:4-hydroxy-tetrahydrodipicolinate synthase